MKKILIMTIVGILLISSIGSIAVSDDKNNQIMKNIEMDLSFSEISITNDNQLTSLKINNANTYLLEPGKPMLPANVETYTFPIGTEITNIQCLPLDIQSYQLSSKIEATAQPSLSGVGSTIDDVSIIYGDAPYPNKWFEYDVGCGIQNNERCLILKIKLYPVQYMPGEDSIDVAGDFKIDITLKENEQKPQQNSADDQYKFIVLTPSTFIGNLQSFSNHKINRGISTKIITLNEIYNGVYFPTQGRDDPEKIKYFIKNAIETWGSQYVMLVGGVDDFPVRLTHVLVDYDPDDPDEEIFITDLYYADIYDEEFAFSSWDSNGNDVFGEYEWGSNKLYDDVDLYPDIYLGRLAVSDDDELDGVINKIITYETMESYKQDWFSEIMVIGGDTSPQDSSNVDEGEFTNQFVLDIMTGFSADKVWDSNYRLSWYNPSGVDNINDGFADGRGFVDWAGHGGATVWTTYPHNGTRQSLPSPSGSYRSSHALDLENPDMYPVVVVGACSTGKFSVPDCLAWSFVKNPNGGGIAAFSATSLSWGYDTEYVVQGLGGRMHVSYFYAYKDGADTFGQMWADGVTRYIQPNMDGGEHKTGEQWEPFGDPTLQIAEPSNPPAKPETPTGPSKGKTGDEQIFTTVSTDPDGDDIYYRWDWGNGNIDSWVGPYSSGQEIEITHVWDEKGSYSISVQAKDTNGKLGEWSDPLETSMAKTKGMEFPLFEFLWNHFSFFSIFEFLFNN